ncbi:MAG: YkgJ family cysteine cluster protein [Candidatus Omnitrophica bacterium]|nr:YkgJ family cysteine cluster protein [Candidatus Omnitrophota bacterium]
MEQFQCQRCGACCRQPGFVYLSETDVTRLAAFLGAEVYAFTDSYTLLWERRYLALKKNADETCFFLGAEGCKVYDARPDQCRDYPLKWKTKRSTAYCAGLKGNV